MSAVVSTQKQPMSEPTWSAKSKPASPKTTRATRQPLPTMWETTSEMWAGMGADLYESYCGSILATSALGAAAFVASGDVEMQYKAVVAPMLIAAVGIVLSIIGIFAVRTKENATIRELLKALAIGTNLSSVLIALSYFRHSLFVRVGQLVLDQLFGHNRIVGRDRDRPIDGILYFPVL